MTFDFNTLPKDIRVKFGPFGLGHKLGDSAAGREALKPRNPSTRSGKA